MGDTKHTSTGCHIIETGFLADNLLNCVVHVPPTQNRMSDLKYSGNPTILWNTFDLCGFRYPHLCSTSS